MDKLTHVYDCTGNLIFFDRYVLDDNKRSIKLSDDQYLIAVETIAAPTLIIELNNNCPVRYYYRANGDRSLILGVKFSNGIWQVNEYIENTTVSFLLTRLKQHLRDGQITIYLENEMEDNALGNLF